MDNSSDVLVIERNSLVVAQIGTSDFPGSRQTAIMNGSAFRVTVAVVKLRHEIDGNF
jgi:hypothetical protein